MNWSPRQRGHSCSADCCSTPWQKGHERGVNGQQRSSCTDSSWWTRSRGRSSSSCSNSSEQATGSAGEPHSGERSRRWSTWLPSGGLDEGRYSYCSRPSSRRDRSCARSCGRGAGFRSSYSLWRHWSSSFSSRNCFVFSYKTGSSCNFSGFSSRRVRSFLSYSNQLKERCGTLHNCGRRH